MNLKLIKKPLEQTTHSLYIITQVSELESSSFYEFTIYKKTHFNEFTIYKKTLCSFGTDYLSFGIAIKAKTTSFATC